MHIIYYNSTRYSTTTIVQFPDVFRAELVQFCCTSTVYHVNYDDAHSHLIHEV